MKLSKETRDVLENFAQLQPSMLFQKGTAQRTNTFTKALLADVEFQEDFPQQFGIFDLTQFLSVLSIFNEPNLDFDEKALTVSEGKQKVVYRYCNPDLVSRHLIPFGKKLDLPSVDIAFELNKELFGKITDATRVLGLTHIAVAGDGDTISVKSCNPKDEHYSFANFEVGTTDKVFNMLISLDHLKIMPHNYKINISKGGLVKFLSQDMELTYTFGCEKDSSFDG